MRLFGKRAKNNDSSDSFLVMASLGGDRDAFGEIVSRYQSLLCSLAYSSVGDIKHSEDIAQETFVEAWRKLDTLRDPEKLKAWLCGILRFKVGRYRRSEARKPVKEANEQLEYASGEQTEVENIAIREEQQALLWKTLEKLPESYREPLILFYREQRSVESVARELDLTEATAKQRLSRGRKILQEAMVSFVEEALAKSKPSAAFTSMVLLTIAGISQPTKAAALGAGAVKAGTLFKWASVLTILASFSGVIGSFFSLRAGLDQTRTQQERRTTIQFVALFFIAAIVFVVGMFALRYLALNNIHYAGYFATASQLLVLAFSIMYIKLLLNILVGLPRLRAQERINHPEAFQAEIDQPRSKRREYKSRASLFGAPLMHFKFGMPEMGEKPAFAWIAGGDRAYGLLFAWGGFALAPISVGIVSVGAISIGALGIGLFAMGTVCVGVVGFGASSIAYKAYASLSALGWESAISGGFSIANTAALGPIPFAQHTNSAHAAEIAHLAALNENYLWVLCLMAAMVIVPAVWHSNKVRQKMT